MSWDAYVKDSLVGTGKVKQGAILGLSGGVWATSEGFTISAAEAKVITDSFKDPSVGQAKGVFVNGVKYLLIRADTSILYCKKGSTGLSIAKTGQAVVLGRYDEDIQPGLCNTVVEKLADYLKEQNY